MDNLETFATPLTFKAGDDDGSGKFTAYGAVFENVDDGGDIIKQGAFKKLRLKGNGKIRIPLYHDMRQVVGEGVVTQDAKGLKVEGELNMSLSYAADAYELMKDGTLDAMSVGFNILKNGAAVEWDDDYNRTRTITKAELWEVSIVPFGMNRKAKIKNVKSGGMPSVREFEQLLRTKGFSRRESQAIIASGYKSMLSDSVLTDGERDSAKSSATLASVKKAIANNPIIF